MVFAFLSILFYLIAITLGLNSLVSNYMYGVTIGDGVMSYVYGIAGAMVDAFKTAIPATVMLISIGAMQERAMLKGRGKTPLGAMESARRRIWLLWLLFAGLTIWSIFCALSLQAQTVSDARTGVEAEQSALSDLSTDKADIRAKLDRLRRELASTAELEGMEQNEIFTSPRRSDQCRNATIRSSIEFCERYNELRARVGWGRSARRIRAEIQAAETELAETRNRIGGVDRDQASREIDPALATLASFAAGEGVTQAEAMRKATALRASLMAILFEGVGSFSGLLAVLFLSMSGKILIRPAMPEPISLPVSAPVSAPGALETPAPKTEAETRAKPRPSRRAIDVETLIKAIKMLSETGDDGKPLYSLRGTAEHLKVNESTLRGTLKRTKKLPPPNHAARPREGGDSAKREESELPAAP